MTAIALLFSLLRVDRVLLARTNRLFADAIVELTGGHLLFDSSRDAVRAPWFARAGFWNVDREIRLGERWKSRLSRADFATSECIANSTDRALGYA